MNTAALLARHLSGVTLVAINTGCTKPYPQPRGRETFRRLWDYPFDDWRRRRGSQGELVAELAVDGGVPDVAELVLQVDRRQGDRVLEVIWGAG